MTIARWAPTGVFASALLVGLVSSVVLAKKPPNDPPPPPPAPPILYELEWLAVDHASPSTRASDVNVDEIIVGNSRGWDGNKRAFVYTETTGIDDLNLMVDDDTQVVLYDELLGPLPGELFGPLPESITLSSADCINDAGQIAGEFVDEEGVGGIYLYDFYADVLYMHPLSDVRRVTDLSENDEIPEAAWGGTVVGWVYSSDDTWGFAWKPGGEEGVIRLPNSPFAIRDATGINSFGEIVGRISLGKVSNAGPIYRYTLGDPELMILSEESDRTHSGFELTAWSGIDRIDVNDNGVVVGNLAGGRYFHPARFDEIDRWTILTRDFSGTSVEINNAGQICGFIYEKGFKIPDTGFVYHPVDGFWSLNELVNGDEADVDTWFSGNAQDNMRPQGISNPGDSPTGYGTIVGYKTFWSSGAGLSMGFVLRPGPVPAE